MMIKILMKGSTVAGRLREWRENMIKKAGIGKRALSLFLTLVLGISLIQMSALADDTPAGSDVTGKLENFSLAMTQDGKEIAGGGTIDTGKSFEMKGTFDSLSLEGIQTGDYATIEFPEWLQFANSNTVEMQADGLKVADVTFDKNVATIQFNLTKVPEGATEITNAWFTASMKYAGTDGKDDGSAQSFTILHKDYTYKFDHVIHYSIEKAGELTDSNDAVNWKITAGAKYSDDAAAPLAGAVITDDLSKLLKEGQDLSGIQNSVTVKDSTGNDISAQAEVKIDENGVLTCTFKDEATATSAVVSFATPFDKSAAYVTGTATVSNSATLSKDDSSEKSNTHPVTYEPKWIVKSLEGRYSDPDCGTPSNSGLYYQWTIQVNPDGFDLKAAKIAETLPDKLAFVSANSDNGKSWDALPENSVFELGDITKAVTLTIVTKVKDQYIYNGTPKQSISADSLKNSAKFSWDGSGEYSSGSVGPAQGIGFSPIAKGGTYTAADQTVQWTVTVPKASLVYGTGLRVLDLVAMEKGFDRNSVTDSTWADAAKNLSLPTAGTAYVADSAASDDGLTVTPVTLTDGAGKKATLLVATGYSAAAAKDNYKFTYQTKVTDPNIYAGNSQKVTNTAALYDGNQWIQNGPATVTTGKMLMKDVLPLAKAQELETAAVAKTDVSSILNSVSVDDSNSFNYQDHTAYFRILVNADGFDFNAATGKTFSLTDTLPTGWTFEKIAGADFLLCQGKTVSGKIQAEKQLSADEIAALVAMTSSIDKNSMKFDFTTLAHPYVIVVKAKMDDAAFKNLYSGNGAAATFTNTVTASSEAYTTAPPTDTENVISKNPDILTKSLDKTKAETTGELTWTVEYHAYGISRGTVDERTTNTITDTLPAGIDLRTDSVGNLIYDGNITLVRLTMNADGSYSDGDAITGAELSKMVTYSMKDRVLTLTLPDSNSDSYRLTYVTDVTGAAGAAGAELKNTVALNSSTQNASGVQAGYQITAAAAGATLRFGGRLQIEKIGANGARLSGARFDLVNEKGITVRTVTTDDSGTAVLKAIPSGGYTLREGAAPTGYLPAADRTVIVATDGTVQVGGAAVSGPLKITDVLTDSASLTVSKRVTGNAVSADDRTRQFTFHIVLSDGKTADYAYTAENMDGGNLHFENGEATVPLTSGQSLTLWNLPVDETYTVTEESNPKDGFVTSVNGKPGAVVSGILGKGTTASAAFENAKNTPYYPGNPTVPTVPTDPGTEIPNKPTPTDPGTEIPDTPTPTDPSKPDTPSANTPADHGGSTASVPKTGDEMLLWAALAAGSAAGLGILFLRRKRRGGREI